MPTNTLTPTATVISTYTPTATASATPGYTPSATATATISPVLFQDDFSDPDLNDRWDFVHASSGGGVCQVEAGMGLDGTNAAHLSVTSPDPHWSELIKSWPVSSGKVYLKYQMLVTINNPLVNPYFEVVNGTAEGVNHNLSGLFYDQGFKLFVNRRDGTVVEIALPSIQTGVWNTVEHVDDQTVSPRRIIIRVNNVTLVDYQDTTSGNWVVPSTHFEFAVGTYDRSDARADAWFDDLVVLADDPLIIPTTARLLPYTERPGSLELRSRLPRMATRPDQWNNSRR